jgi:16S rRNA (guanine527-N7)-methyltransferase
MTTSWPFDISLDPDREVQLLAYAHELTTVNRRFNLISRADEDRIVSHHVGHCLALAFRSISPGTRVVDWGTGGGLPAIVLGILFPDISVLGVDSNQKKTRSVDLFARRVGVPNVTSWHGRAEACEDQANLSVSRATAPLKDLWSWHVGVALEPRPIDQEEVWKDGLLCLKGGDLREEIADMFASFPGLIVERIPLKTLTADPYFATKEIIHVSAP